MIRHAHCWLDMSLPTGRACKAHLATQEDNALAQKKAKGVSCQVLSPVSSAAAVNKLDTQDRLSADKVCSWAPRCEDWLRLSHYGRCVVQLVERSLQQGILLSLATSKRRMSSRMGEGLRTGLLRGAGNLQPSRSRKHRTSGSVTKRLLTVNAKPHLLQAFYLSEQLQTRSWPIAAKI